MLVSGEPAISAIKESSTLLGIRQLRQSVVSFRYHVTGRVHPVTWMLLGYPNRSIDALHAQVCAKSSRVQYDIWDPHLTPLWNTPRFRDEILTRVRLQGAVLQWKPGA